MFFQEFYLRKSIKLVYKVVMKEMYVCRKSELFNSRSNVKLIT